MADEKKTKKQQAEEPEVVEETTPDAPAADAETPEPAEVEPTAEPAADAEPETAEEASTAEAEGPAEVEAAVEEAAAEPAPAEAEAEVEEPEPAAEAAETSEAAAGDDELQAEVEEGTAEAEQPAPVQKTKSRKHLPRSARRQRTKPTRERPAERKPIVRLPKPESELGRRQERRGVVVSDAMDKTIVVKVDVFKLHPKYKKVIRRSRKFHAHDERNEAHVGDTVRIVETRPLSKTKSWRLAEVVEVAK